MKKTPYPTKSRRFLFQKLLTKRIIFWGVILLCGGIFSLYVYIHISSPKYDPLEVGSLQLFDHNGILLTQSGKPDGISIPYTGSLDIPLIHAIIAIEDHRFYQHAGIDTYGKMASIVHNLQNKNNRRGGSTITEQYIKNKYFPTTSRTFYQKGVEGLYALEEEWKYTKEEILRKYLDRLYFGNRIFGIETYLSTYYGQYDYKDIPKKDILDIIARIHTPNVSKEREKQFYHYKNQIAKKLHWEEFYENTSPHKRRTYTVDRFPLLTYRIKSEIKKFCQSQENSLKKFLRDDAISKDLCTNPHTSLVLSVDYELMQYSESSLEYTLKKMQEKNATNGAVYIFNPYQQKVLAYIGSRPSTPDGAYLIDMIQVRRSVGSLLKPFVYLFALKNGATPESLILDAPRAYPTSQGKTFIPFNYIPTSYGPTTLKEALASSLNSSTVRITESLDITQVFTFLQHAGLQFDHDLGYYGYGISIGTAELTLENIVQSFSYLADINTPEKFLLMDILQNPMNRKKSFGIASILNTSVPLSVKTGTSTDFRDNWVVSYGFGELPYTPASIIGVWIGNNNNSPMQHISGVSGAGPLWHNIAEFMISKKYFSSKAYDTLSPKGIFAVPYCLDIGCNKKQNTFSKRNAPIFAPHKPYSIQDFFGIVTPEETQQWNIHAS